MESDSYPRWIPAWSWKAGQNKLGGCMMSKERAYDLGGKRTQAWDDLVINVVELQQVGVRTVAYKRGRLRWGRRGKASVVRRD